MSLGHPKVITSDLKLCPLLDRQCLGAKCMLWVRYDRADRTAYETCTFVLGQVLQSQQIIELQRNEAATESARNQTAVRLDQLALILLGIWRRDPPDAATVVARQLLVDRLRETGQGAGEPNDGIGTTAGGAPE